MTYFLSEFDFSTLTRPWWLNVVVSDPGILTISNVVSKEERLYELSEVHEDLIELQEKILNAVHNFTEEHSSPGVGDLAILDSFTGSHNGVELSFQKSTGLFITIHNESGYVLKHYSLIDLFILGPSIIERDGDAYEMMSELGML